MTSAGPGVGAEVLGTSMASGRSGVFCRSCLGFGDGVGGGGLGRLWGSVGLQEGSYLGFWIPAWPLVKQEASSGFVGLDIGTGDF